MSGVGSSTGILFDHQHVNTPPSLKSGLNKLQSRVVNRVALGQPFDVMQRIVGTVPALVTARR